MRYFRYFWRLRNDHRRPYIYLCLVIHRYADRHTGEGLCSLPLSDHVRLVVRSRESRGSTCSGMPSSYGPRKYVCFDSLAPVNRTWMSAMMPHTGESFEWNSSHSYARHKLAKVFASSSEDEQRSSESTLFVKFTDALCLDEHPDCKVQGFVPEPTPDRFLTPWNAEFHCY